MRTATRLATLLALLAATAAMAAGPVGEPGSLERTRAIVELFQARFGQIGPQLAGGLDQLYTADIRFRDPITAVSGLPDLERYLEHFGTTAAGARFRISDTVIQPASNASRGHA